MVNRALPVDHFQMLEELSRLLARRRGYNPDTLILQLQAGPFKSHIVKPAWQLFIEPAQAILEALDNYP